MCRSAARITRSAVPPPELRPKLPPPPSHPTNPSVDVAKSAPTTQFTLQTPGHDRIRPSASPYSKPRSPRRAVSPINPESQPTRLETIVRHRDSAGGPRISPSRRGASEGHRAFDLQPQSTITNGAVGDVVASRSKNFSADTGRRCTPAFAGAGAEHADKKRRLGRIPGSMRTRWNRRFVRLAHRPGNNTAPSRDWRSNAWPMACEPRRAIRVFCACPGEGRGASPSYICAKIPS
jgi:hypothetical protein